MTLRPSSPTGNQPAAGAPASAQLSDEWLIARLRSGDAKAGEVLCQRYTQALLTYLLRITRNPHQAEELHQQTWLSVLEHIDKFDPAAAGSSSAAASRQAEGGVVSGGVGEGSGGGTGAVGGGAGGGGAVPSSNFKAWLFRIATNKANDQWRSASRKKNAHDQLQKMTVQEDEAADASITRNETAKALRDAIARLPESQRQVVEMRYFANLKFNEIAEILGCPLNTALGRMHKAASKLKQWLSDP